MPIPRPARPVLRRGRGRVQLGLDPERSVVVERLSDIASTALVRLDGRTGRHEVLRFAPDLADVLDELDRRGLLDDDPGPYAGLSSVRRERLAPDLAALAASVSSTPEALRVLARRTRSSVDVRGTDRVAAHVAVGLAADGVPHLPVAVTADAARVGPLVLPGTTACLWCLEHRARDLDPAWPALTDQVRLRHSTARAQGSVLAAAAAATAIAQARQLVDTPGTAQPLSIDAILELRAPDAVVSVLPVARHPVCGCGWAGGTRTMVG